MVQDPVLIGMASGTDLLLIKEEDVIEKRII